MTEEFKEKVKKRLNDLKTALRFKEEGIVNLTTTQHIHIEREKDILERLLGEGLSE